MKIFITYASAGAGHFKAAEAIYKQFRKTNPAWETKLIDVLPYSNPVFKNIYIHGYAFMISYAPWLWAKAFSLTSNSLLRPLINQIRFIINRLNNPGFRKLIIRENPDFIISTHFLSSELTSDLKRARQINSKLITVITDFGVHPFWLLGNTDIYIAACEFTKHLLLLEGVAEDKIMALGIPIDDKFIPALERSALFRKFNLDERKFSVLVVTGSFGIGPIKKIAELLHKEAQVLVVCARNKRLYARMQKTNFANVRVFGFVDNIEELMGISDIIITKPGGLTISESLAMELVPIFILAIPGQEAENINILAKFGIGIKPKNIGEIRDIVLDYKMHPDKINRIKENIRKIKKLSAAEELYHVVCKSSAGAAR